MNEALCHDKQVPLNQCLGFNEIRLSGVGNSQGILGTLQNTDSDVLPMKKAPFGAFLLDHLAEQEGFEPSKQVLPAYSLSRGAPSATRSPLR